MPTEQTRDAVRQRLLDRWIGTLQRQGDAVSLASADYLIHRARSDEAAAQAGQRLQVRAFSSSDPYVFQLWYASQAFCTAEGAQCPPGAAERWARLEPDNALAWLPPRAAPNTAMSGAQWAGLALATRVELAEVALRRRLLSTLDASRPGLELEQGLELIEDLQWHAAPDAASLEKQCAQQALPSAARSACLHAADLFWRRPQVSEGDWLAAFGIAHLHKALDRPPWSERFEAMGAVLDADRQVLRAAAVGLERSAGCNALAARHQRLQERLRGGSLALVHQHLAAKTATPR